MMTCLLYYPTHGRIFMRCCTVPQPWIFESFFCQLLFNFLKLWTVFNLVDSVVGYFNLHPHGSENFGKKADLTVPLTTLRSLDGQLPFQHRKQFFYSGFNSESLTSRQKFENQSVFISISGERGTRLESGSCEILTAKMPPKKKANEPSKKTDQKKKEKIIEVCMDAFIFLPVKFLADVLYLIFDRDTSGVISDVEKIGHRNKDNEYA